MCTFDASIRRSTFWLAVIIPPAGYWGLVQIFAHQAGEGTVSLTGFVVLIALANGLPLAALGWVLYSVAAYTITADKVIEHRVVRDREFVLGPSVEISLLPNGDIVVVLPERTLRLRVTEPARCLVLLREAEAAVRT